MFGIGDAIIAQIALTAPALPDIKWTSWTDQAALGLAFVTGLLSASFSCVLYIHTSSLLSNY